MTVEWTVLASVIYKKNHYPTKQQCRNVKISFVEDAWIEAHLGLTRKPSRHWMSNRSLNHLSSIYGSKFLLKINTHRLRNVCACISNLSEDMQMDRPWHIPQNHSNHVSCDTVKGDPCSISTTFSAHPLSQCSAAIRSCKDSLLSSLISSDCRNVPIIEWFYTQRGSTGPAGRGEKFWTQQKQMTPILTWQAL